MADTIPGALAAQLDALDLVTGRPLVAVDADEVLVVFVSHLTRYLAGIGYEMRLEQYRLEGSIYPAGSETPVPFDGCLDLIDRFFGAETERQAPVPGGREALERLSDSTQIVILTNVPAHGGAARRRNLDALGIRWPMVVNHGGKGRALAWMAQAVDAPVAMIDDSVSQIESVARHVPDAVRLHFAADPAIRRFFPDCPAATRQVHDWPEAERAVRELLLA